MAPAVLRCLVGLLADPVVALVLELLCKLRTAALGDLPVEHHVNVVRLDVVEPDHVHVMLEGEIAKSGDAELAEQLEDEGYEWVRQETFKAA